MLKCTVCKKIMPHQEGIREQDLVLCDDLECLKKFNQELIERQIKGEIRVKDLYGKR